MKKDNDDAKNKHARLSEKHAKAVVLREKWLEENEGKTREDWNPKKDMKAMEKKYEVKWEDESKQPSLMRFVKPRGEKPSKESESKVETLAQKGSIEVEFLLCVSSQEKISRTHTCDVRSCFMANLCEIESPLKNRAPGNYDLLHLANILNMRRIDFLIQREGI